MKKDQMLGNLKAHYQEILETLDREEVEIKFYLNEHCDDFHYDEIRRAHSWITHIYENEFRRVKSIKRLLSEELWQRYKAWGGFDEHREVVLLKHALSELRKALITKKRPDVFKKKKPAKKQLVSKAD